LTLWLWFGQEDVILDLEVGRGERAGEVKVQVDIGESARKPSTRVYTDERRLPGGGIDEHRSIHAGAVRLAFVHTVRAESRAGEHDRQNTGCANADEGTSLQLILLLDGWS
jgi:hypothetical protein